jgi:biotin synthase-like enzyme
MRALTLDKARPFLHEQARTVRDGVFGRRVFVRGVVEVSSYCRQNCHYCAMRRDNRMLERYRLVADELAELIKTPFVSAPCGDIDLALDCVAWMRLRDPDWIIPAVSAMQLVSEDGYVRAFNAGANLATINLTPRAVRADYPIYKRDRIIMDEERVLSAIAEADCELSGVGIAEHLRKKQ